MTILSFCSGIHSINVECEIVQNEEFLKYVAKHWTITTPDVMITSINGHDAPYYLDKNITYLDIHDQTVHHLPKGIENFFPHLEQLAVVNAELESINSGFLKPFVNLRVVYLKHNKITSLDSNLFEFNPEITTLAISHNQLKHIGVDILTPLKKLTYADFSSNGCVDNLIDEEGSETVDFSALVTDFKTKCI